jgi:hypothetical protein
MRLKSCVDSLLARAVDPAKAVHSTTQQRISIYANGLLSKESQSLFSLEEISAITRKTPTGASIPEKIHFFSDSFWVFQRAEVDILAQLVNQGCSFHIDEKDCNFSKLFDHVTSRAPSHAIAAHLATIHNSPEYRALNDYRNCSVHRRQVYLELRRVDRVYDTPGYATGSFTQFEWYICDNPLDIVPAVSSRLVEPYCRLVYISVCDLVETAVNALLA